MWTDSFALCFWLVDSFVKTALKSSKDWIVQICLCCCCSNIAGCCCMTGPVVINCHYYPSGSNINLLNAEDRRQSCSVLCLFWPPVGAAATCMFLLWRVGGHL